MGTQPCVILAAPRGFHRVVRDCPDNGFQLIAEPWVFRGHAVDGMPGPLATIVRQAPALSSTLPGYSP